MTGPAVFCPRCGQANPPAAQWCSRCGFRPSGGQPAPARGGQMPMPMPMPAPPPGHMPPQPLPPRMPPAGPVPYLGRTELRPADPEPAGAGRASGPRLSRQERKAARAARTRADVVVAAPIGRRVAAALIDLVPVAAAILWPLYRVYELDETWRPPLVLALGVVLLVGVTAWRGQYGHALGGWLLKVRTLRDTEPAVPGVRAMVKRHLVTAGAAPLLLAPVWSMLLDSSGRRRAWQDRAAGTRVIDTRWGVDPLALAQEAAAAAAAARIAASVPGDGTPVQARGRARPAVLASGVDMTPLLQAPVLVGAAAAPYVPNLGARVRSGPDPAAFATPIEREVLAPVLMDRGAAELTEVAPAVPAAGPSSAAAESAEETASSVVLEFDSGERVTVTGSGLIGRDPEPAEGEQVDHIIALPDNTRTVSKTHVRIGLVAGNLLIEDFHSTNGSAIEHSGARLPLVPGTPVPAPVGSTVHLGSRTFRVLAS